MINYNLALDEGIILEDSSHDAYWLPSEKKYGEERMLDSIVLTNKRILFSFEYKESFFGKSQRLIFDYSFSDIKVIDGIPMVNLTDSICGLALQIQFVQSREMFVFYNNDRLYVWYSELYKRLTGEEPPEMIKRREEEEKARIPFTEREEYQEFKEKVGEIGKEFRDVFGIKNRNKKETKDSSKKENVDDLTSSATNSSNELGRVNSFCGNCGTRIVVGSRFCSNCGAAVRIEPDKIKPPPLPPNMYM